MYLILNKEHLTFPYSTNILLRMLTGKYEELSYPKNQKMCDLVIVTSSREKATPSSGTSPLASYKEVPPPPPEIEWSIIQSKTDFMLVEEY